MKVTSALAGALAVTSALAVCLPAEAQSPPAPTSVVGLADAAGDVQSFHGAVHPDPPAQQVLASRRNGDLTRIRVAHTADAVRVRLRFRDLVRSGEQHQYVFRFVTPRLQRIVRIQAFRGPLGPIDRHAYWSGTTPQMSGPYGAERHCAGMARSIDYTANTVVLSVPRSCLGRPRSIRVGARMSVVTNYQTGSFDDAFGSGSNYRDPITLGPPALRPGSF